MLTKRQEGLIKTRIAAIYNQKSLLAMMSCVRGNVFMQQAQILTRREMDRVLLRPL